MDLGKFIDYACSVDANRLQAGKQKGGAESGGSGGSGKSSVSYKDKLQNNKRAADSQGDLLLRRARLAMGRASSRPSPRDRMPSRRLTTGRTATASSATNPGTRLRIAMDCLSPLRARSLFRCSVRWL